MKVNLNKFKSQLPLQILDVLKTINAQGFSAGLIGGFTRDYLIEGSFSYDIDIEVRKKNKKADYKNLCEALEANIENDFEIITFCQGDYNFEISRPRIENYKEDISHKNFSFKFVETFDNAFKRRDFTLNAIMFLYDEGRFELVDPCNGVLDLSNRVLNNCSDDFIFDPVRYLRAYRFKEKLKFSFSENLENKLEQMKNYDFSAHYLRSEANKSPRPLSFLKNVFGIEEDPLIIFDNHRRKLDESINKSISLKNKRKMLLEKLGFSVKGVFNIESLNEKSFKTLKDHFSREEIVTIFNFLNIENIDIDKLFFKTLEISLVNIKPKDRAKYIFSKRMEYALK
ncbi:MAG: hypothetical protein N4A33_10310 [Bacteriovoracaceae bacterium]|jgi:hypothetical protein|nr:hypothetical protein [Bacteriovoracaceae bacterium]